LFHLEFEFYRQVVERNIITA